MECISSPRYERHWLRTAATSLILAFTLVVGTACSKRAVDTAVKDGVLIVVNGAEVQGLDPHAVTGFPEHQVIMTLLEGLVTDDPVDNLKVQPGVAERWEHNPSCTVWTFYLNPNAKWSNGDPVTADDFVYSYKRMLSPKLGALYVEMLYDLKNAEDYFTGKTTDFSTVGVKALNLHTLELSLGHPVPHFLSKLTHYSFFPVHRPTIEKFGAQERRGTNWTQPGNYIGNGPFVLTKWVTNQYIEVHKNPLYWNAANNRLNGIRFLPMENAAAAESAFLAGQVHRIDTIPASKRDYYRQKRPDITRDDPFFNTSYLNYNVRHKPLDDVRVRRALALTIDRRTIVEKLTHNGRPATSFVPPGITGYKTAGHQEWNPEAARALLAEAGYPGGSGFPDKLELLITTNDTTKMIAEALQEMWRKELGIAVQIRLMEWRSLLEATDKGDFDLFLLSWIGDYIDPETFLSIMTTTSGNNRTGWSNASFDQLMRDSKHTGDAAERFRLLGEAEAILLEEAPIAPIAWANRLYLLHPSVKNWNPKLQDIRPYQSLYFEE
ncbi:MAG: peptide ABC transporter substrate-binding protein [Verrucomicrobiota bacterium]|nr:peptide ABC transporter substrate-binding protein [Verrucomicrobiota bacterium]